MFQNKRKSSILMNPRKPSFLSEMDEEKNRKKIMNIFDVYTEEQMINVIIIYFFVYINSYKSSLLDSNKNSSKTKKL